MHGRSVSMRLKPCELRGVRYLGWDFTVHNLRWSTVVVHPLPEMEQPISRCVHQVGEQAVQFQDRIHLRCRWSTFSSLCTRSTIYAEAQRRRNRRRTRKSSSEMGFRKPLGVWIAELGAALPTTAGYRPPTRPVPRQERNLRAFAKKAGNRLKRWGRVLISE